MSNIENALTNLELPQLLQMKDGTRVNSIEDFERRQDEIRLLLQKKEYGMLPPIPDHMDVEILSEDPTFCAGKVTLQNLVMHFTMGEDRFSFPAFAAIPRDDGRHPAFVHINFRPNVPDKYMPTEEICDRGYAVFSFCYTDVTSDDNNFKDKCARYLCKSRRAKTAPGKIVMWAWAAMRVMDYAQSLDAIDPDNIAVVGHSRLGKTALLTGALDKRFKHVISNDSGCSGAALFRDKIGETIPVITDVFPFWFCPAFTEFGSDGNLIPKDFDQHFLLAASVPRHVIVGSAEEDLWADPKNEFLALAAINEAYRLYGMRGLVHNDEIPTAKAILDGGEAMYQVRKGLHYFSREDWLAYVDYIDKFIK